MLMPRAVALLLLLASVAAPPSAAADDDFRARMLELDLGFYGSAAILRGGEDLGFEHFGGNAEDIFGVGTPAAESAGTYRAMRIAGFTLTMVGAALLVTELVLILSGSEAVIDDTATGADGLKPLTFILLGSGLGLSVVGIGLETSSLGYLSDAVREHNAALATTARSPAAGPRFGLAVRADF